MVHDDPQSVETYTFNWSFELPPRAAYDVERYKLGFDIVDKEIFSVIKLITVPEAIVGKSQNIDDADCPHPPSSC